jgi:hypothetical protein
MAGGVWFLGQAVAQADVGQTNDTAQENTQTADSQNGDGTTGNIAGNFNSSSNSAHITVSTNVSGGNGGTNTSNVNTGVQGADIVVASGGGGGGGGGTPLAAASSSGSQRGGDYHKSNDANGELTISTRSVYVEQNANGGSVSGSGNISELPNVNQENNVYQSNDQSASSEDNGHNWWNNNQHGEKNMFKSQSMGRGNDGPTGNIAGNFNHSSNRLWLDVSTNVYGGNGGFNDSNVNTGVQDAFLGCFAGHRGDADCSADIETGSVTVIQNANGGDVSDSGNIGSHGTTPASSTPPKQENAAVSPASAPAAKAAAAKSAALSSSQPSKGSLAFTGADVSLALTLGLLALGLGGAFTLAGRRRETGTV